MVPRSTAVWAPSGATAVSKHSSTQAAKRALEKPTLDRPTVFIGWCGVSEPQIGDQWKTEVSQVSSPAGGCYRYTPGHWVFHDESSAALPVNHLSRPP